MININALPYWFYQLVIMLMAIQSAITAGGRTGNMGGSGFTPTTWYVSSTIGGPRTSPGNVGAASCNGLGTATFNPGGIDGQNCPFQVGLWLWNDPYTYNVEQWVIAGGDIVMDLDVGPTQPNQFSGSTGNYGQGCWGIGPNCSPPPVPSGTSAHHTMLLGINYNNSCSTVDAYGTTIADPAKISYLWAGGGTGNLLNLSTSQHVDVQCFQFRSHSNCNGITISCSGTEWAQYGIATGSNIPATSDDINITNVQITGFQSRGLRGNLGGTWNFTNVEISMNGSAGFDLDPGGGQDSINTIVNWNNVIIAWNGCSRQFPDVSTVPIQTGSCTDDVSGGYGDGVATVSGTTGIISWTMVHSRLNNNTQDGIDLGHFAQGTVVYINNLLFGNMGGALKVGNATVLTEYNNLSEANCTEMAQPITGVTAGFNSNLSDYCRAGGDQNTFNYDPVSYAHGLTVDIEFNTFVGTGGTVMDAQCFNGPCTTQVFTFKNNAIYALSNAIASPTPPYPWNGGALPQMWNNMVPTTQSKNLFWNLHSCPAVVGDISATCTANTNFVGQPASPITAEVQLANFNFHPATGSALIHAGVSNSAVPTDYYGITRPNPPTVGAVEP